jgi:hypothetical protein
MSRRPPNRRRRPGRRPPNRYSGRHGPPTLQGFTGPGFRQLYEWMLPGLGGTAKKHHFNDVSRGIILAWLGAILGLGGGIAAGGSFAESQRFHRD